MFNYIGRKIKLLAEVLCWIGIIGSIICGFAFIITGAADKSVESVIGGFLYLICGPFISWASSFVLFGFGKLVENSCILVEMYRNATGFDDEYDIHDEHYS